MVWKHRGTVKFVLKFGKAEMALRAAGTAPPKQSRSSCTYLFSNSCDREGVFER